MSVEAMKQAVEALEISIPTTAGREAIKALRQAIAEAEKQEPVAWADYGVLNWIADMQFKHASYLYTHPQPKREWVELTPEEVLAHANDQLVPKFFAMGAAWANAKLKEKNT